jgi:hypothetical protein
MKLKKPTSKVLGELTGKLVAGAVALPGKTSETTGSIKAEFLAGFNSTNGSTKVKGNKSVDIISDVK